MPKSYKEGTPDKEPSNARDKAILTVVKHYQNHPLVSKGLRIYDSPTAAALDRQSDGVGWYLNAANRYRLLSSAEEVELYFAIQAGIEVYETHGLKDLSAEQETALINMAVAYRAMFCTNTRLVISIVRRLGLSSQSALTFLDIVQFGNEGLSIAIRRFDGARGYKFSTYATWWIEQSIKRGVAQTSREIRLPVQLHDQWVALRGLTKKLTQTLEREPTVNELAEAMGESPNTITMLLQRGTFYLHSLNRPVGEDQTQEAGDLIADNRFDDELDVLSDKEELARLFVAADISPRDTAIISLLYNVFFPHMKGVMVRTAKGEVPYEAIFDQSASLNELSLQDIADVLGLSRETVRQAELKTISKLRPPRQNPTVEDQIA